MQFMIIDRTDRWTHDSKGRWFDSRLLRSQPWASCSHARASVIISLICPYVRVSFDAIASVYFIRKNIFIF